MTANFNSYCQLLTRVSLTPEAELGIQKTVTELISPASFMMIVPLGLANNGPPCSSERNVRTTILVRAKM